MRRIAAIARIYCLEVVRDRFFLALLVLGVLIVFASLILGGMSFAEQNRILTHLSLSSVHLVTVGIAIFLGAFSISREIENRTYISVLARPITRLQFLLGKFAGLILICFVVVSVFSILLLILLGNVDLIGNMFRIGISLWAEAAILVALALFWGVQMKPFLAVTCTIGIYLIGHWQESLLFFAKQSESAVYENFAIVISYITPNLESVNFRSYTFLADGVPLSAWSLGIIHVFAWICGLIILSGVIFRGRDLV